jgi:hypothetical protein
VFVCPRENTSGIDRVKAVLLTAKITTHFDIATLGQDAFGFFYT